ncbi:MAG: TIGR04141 family sporadically distributed protein [Thermoanaerobaculia bacterium]
MAKNRTLTVLLLKEEGYGAADFIKPDEVGDRVLDRRELEVGTEIFFLFILKTSAQPPRWADFFSDHLTPYELGSVSTASAALLVRVTDSWFAVTFGQGRHLIRPEAIVEDFGLIVTLNAVGKGSLRSIDKETFDAIANHSRLQSSREADAGEFGLDVERDLLRAVTGTPRDPNLAQRLTGMDALAITTEVDLASLSELLHRLTQVFADEAYRANFPWVDNIRSVKDLGDMKDLDAALFATVARGDFSNTWLAPPEILNWASVRVFSYSDASNPRVFTDIHWRTLLRNHRGDFSRDAFKRKRVFCYGDDRRIIRDWALYNCIYAETDFKGSSYILSNGRWYRIATNFEEEVNDWFFSFPKVESALPVYDHDSERLYNEHVAKSSSGHFALLDRKLVNYGGGQSSIEFCDLLGLDGEIIHVKRYSGSRELSHLFMQGLVSCQLFLEDPHFRDALKKVVPEPHWKECRLADGKASGRRITFAVIYRSRGEFVLPFSSRITLRQTSRRLVSYECSPCLSRIRMDEVRAYREKYKDEAI